jgi:hypothetical protein
MTPKIQKKFLNFLNFVPHHSINTPHGLSSFHTSFITFSLSSSHTQYLYSTQEKWRINSPWCFRASWKKSWACCNRKRSWLLPLLHQHEAQNVTIRQPWSWSGSFQTVAQLLRRWLRVPPSYFHRMYHMRRTLFLSIMHKLSETSPHFYERYDRAGRACLTAL